MPRDEKKARWPNTEKILAQLNQTDLTLLSQRLQCYSYYFPRQILAAERDNLMRELSLELSHQLSLSIFPKCCLMN